MAPWGVSQDEPLPNAPEIHDNLDGLQFIQNETCEAIWKASDPQKTRYNLSYKPLPGTITGTIYNDGVAIQQFASHNDGSMALMSIKGSVAKVRGAMVVHATSQIIFEWEGVPGTSDHIVVSYESSLQTCPSVV